MSYDDEKDICSDCGCDLDENEGFQCEGCGDTFCDNCRIEGTMLCYRCG